MPSKRFLIPGLIACLLGAASAASAADGEPWLVSKSSGEIWVTTQGGTQGATQVSLGSAEALKPGDTIRTGPNGRVRLTRGAETMVIAPNSEVGLPAAAKDGMATTILQRAGSILLDVEKRNVQHFEVETPFLAAVVKGTQFRVTVEGRRAKVEVSRGQVQVSDFKSGQIAQVMPGQAATTSTIGRSGLKLSGAGNFNPIEQGRPRAPTINPVSVPRDGLHAPRETKGSVIHALNGNAPARASTPPSSPQRSAAASTGAKPNVVRISSSIGEVNLNIQKATRGLAHGTQQGMGGGRSSLSTDTRGNNGNSTSSSGASSVSAAVTAAVGSPTASASSTTTGSAAANNNGNGNSGNGNSGNSGKGNSDDDHGSGRGRGHAYGHNKD
ncbi:conserved hypothetical protein; putative signal peptide [Bradyrhizobium sp. ORS 278]|uniref:FecR family protein n=1 Tax=Bradyrhizobium sp. (strain ORS 278) TaxID=114615 RepID=UPI00015088DC|nr:FecR family protein [Bradyrhizobium sp. ORS 278]CAL79217.1 conserved hypothetical protein; putative signal peptide [Bradyrhizobium sp. ORS 278]